MTRDRIGQDYIDDGTYGMFSGGQGGDWDTIVTYHGTQFSARDRACENGSNGWPLDMGCPIDTT